jgi:HEAT repeat protein
MNEYAMESARGRAPADTLSETELREALSDERARERRDAALGLIDRAETGLDEATCDTLAARARTDQDSDVRQFAVEALGTAGSRPAALEEALDDADPWVRAEAVVALSRTDTDVTDTLQEATNDENGWVRRNAIIALSKRGEADHDLLVDHLKHDGHPPVREYAAAFLSEFATDENEAVRVLAAVLARDPNAFARAKAAVSLGDFGTDRAEEALETQGLPDRSDDVQRAAKRALARARGNDPDNVDLDTGCGPDSAPGPGGDLAPDRAGSTEGQPPQYGGPSGPGSGPSGHEGPPGGPNDRPNHGG